MYICNYIYITIYITICIYRFLAKPLSSEKNRTEKQMVIDVFHCTSLDAWCDWRAMSCLQNRTDIGSAVAVCCTAFAVFGMALCIKVGRPKGRIVRGKGFVVPILSCCGMKKVVHTRHGIKDW